jgi:hypothetical protein
MTDPTPPGSSASDRDGEPPTGGDRERPAAPPPPEHGSPATPPPPPPGYGAAPTPPPPPPGYGPPPAYGSPPQYGSAPQYGSMPGYPSAPQHGGPGSGSAAPATPPPPLALAVKLMYAGAVLALLEVVANVLERDAIRSQITDVGRLDPATVDAAVTAAVVVASVLSLLTAGLWVLNAVFNARGQKWARILSTILGGLALLFSLGSLAQPAGGLSRVLTFVSLLIAAAVVVLIWRPESSQYYEARSGVPRR